MRLRNKCCVQSNDNWTVNKCKRVMCRLLLLNCDCDCDSNKILHEGENRSLTLKPALLIAHPCIENWILNRIIIIEWLPLTTKEINHCVTGLSLKTKNKNQSNECWCECCSSQICLYHYRSRLEVAKLSSTLLSTCTQSIGLYKSTQNSKCSSHRTQRHLYSELWMVKSRIANAGTSYRSTFLRIIKADDSCYGH